MVHHHGQQLMWNSIRDANRLLRKGATNVTELCNNSFKLIDETQNNNSFITLCKEQVGVKACELDEKLKSKPKVANDNPLYGIPISVKDNFCTKHVLTTCGSKMLSNFIPPYTATAVSRLLKKDCVMLGKTNMDEFAMGSSSTTSYYGPASNPWKVKLFKDEKPGDANASNWNMAGGSSTGSAISVASGACFASIGTDTGGSTRQPASLTGIVGFKPTYGLISRFGVVPLAHCLDVVSILTRNVNDAQIIFDNIVGLDENDLTTIDHEKELMCNIVTNQLGTNRKVRIGIPEEFISNSDMSDDVSRRFQQVLSVLDKANVESYNFELVKLELHNSSLSTECYTIVSSAEISSNMSCYDGVKYGVSIDPSSMKEFDREQFFKTNRDIGFGSEVKKRIILGNYFLLNENRERYLIQALKLRRKIDEEFKKAFNENQIDIIVTPSTPTTSMSYKEWLQRQDDNRLFHADYFLIPANLANLPAISLPIGLSAEGLPIGLQLIANKFCDLDLLQVSKVLECNLFNDFKTGL